MGQFKDTKLGLFRFNGIVYTKINETQAVLITSGKTIDIEPEQEVEEF